MVHLINATPDTENPNAEVIDVGADNFMQEVIEKSKTVPVMVDFWAPWCGPCKNLTPILESLANKHAGAFQLVKVNIDEQQELAMQFQVRSVPTVYLVKDGTVVDGFMGAQPENVVEEFLSKHISAAPPQQPEPVIDDPIQNLIDRGQIAEAVAALEKDGSDESWYRLARLYLNQNDFDKVRTALDKLKDNTSAPEYRFIAAGLHFAELAYGIDSDSELQQRIDQNEQDWDAHYQLAALDIVTGHFSSALERLLQITTHDRKFNDDAGRKGLIMAFDMLGNDHELVSQYRRLLARILH